MPDTASFPNRVDAYAHFRFRLFRDGRCVAGFSKVSTLAPSSSGAQQAASITLERGLTDDPSFRQWLETGPNAHDAPEADSTWRDLELVSSDEHGRPAQRFNLQGARVRSCHLLRDADDRSTGTAIETLTLAYGPLR